MNIIQLPAHKTQKRDRFPDGSEYVKTAELPKAICLESEYAFYLRKFKRIYRIELSHSTKRWVLTVDDGTWGWDQRGDYLRTLCSAIGHRQHSDLLSALDAAMKMYPNEAAFFCPTLREYRSNEPAFDGWYSNLKGEL